METKYAIALLGCYILIFGLMFLGSVQSDRRWKNLRNRLRWPTMQDKLELALRDFIIAYDEQIPELLLGAYHQAGEIIDELERKDYQA